MFSIIADTLFSALLQPPRPATPTRTAPRRAPEPIRRPSREELRRHLDRRPRSGVTPWL